MPSCYWKVVMLFLPILIFSFCLETAFWFFLVLLVLLYEMSNKCKYCKYLSEMEIAELLSCFLNHMMKKNLVVKTEVLLDLIFPIMIVKAIVIKRYLWWKHKKNILSSSWNCYASSITPLPFSPMSGIKLEASVSTELQLWSFSWQLCYWIHEWDKCIYKTKNCI